MKIYLEKLDHQVQVISIKEREQIIEKINKIKPDFVHIQYDEFIDIYPYINRPTAIKSHYGYLEQPAKYDHVYSYVMGEFKRIKPYIFCLSEGIKKLIYKRSVYSLSVYTWSPMGSIYESLILLMNLYI